MKFYWNLFICSRILNLRENVLNIAYAFYFSFPFCPQHYLFFHISIFITYVPLTSHFGSSPSLSLCLLCRPSTRASDFARCLSISIFVLCSDFAPTTRLNCGNWYVHCPHLDLWLWIYFVRHFYRVRAGAVIPQ